MYQVSPVLIRVENSALLAHGLGVGDGGGEEAVPVDPAVQTRPLVVPGPGVRETPGHHSPVLLLCRVALALPVSTRADSSLGPRAALALLHVVEMVQQLLGPGPVLQLHHLVGQVPPVRPRGGGNELEPGKKYSK